MSKRFNTQRPRLSETMLAQIRKDARRYVLAGGGMVQNVEGDLDEHIGNVRELLKPGLGDRFGAALKKHVPDYKTHEALWTLVWDLVSAEGEAGFAFGVAVGSEVAAQTLGVGVKGGAR